MTQRLRAIAIIAGLSLLALGMINCTSSPDRRAEDRDSGPDEIIGGPPQQGDEDYEFAMPPSHPGTPEPVAGAPATEWEPGSETIDRHYIEQLEHFGPSLVLQHVHTEPAHESDGFVGFEIVEITPHAEQYISPRLQPGDIITHINLVRLKMPDDYMEAWKTLNEAEEIRIDIVRDGESKDVIWDIE